MTALSLDLSPQLTLQPLPQLVASAAFLALTTAEVDAAVENELDVNPALERERSPAAVPPLAELADLAAPRSTREALLADARIALPAQDHPIAEHVVGSLDAHGFLREPPAELAHELGVALDRVERSIGAVRAAGPTGTAARDVRECLLLQVDEWPPSRLRALVRRLVAAHLEQLARGRLGAIATALGVAENDVEAAAAALRDRLRPYPLDEVEPWERPVPAPPVDVVVLERDDGLAVEVVEPTRVRLRGSGGVDDLAQARGLLDRVERRRRTLQAVAEAAVRRQGPFVREGRALRPLTHAEIAAEVGVHPSTVSRAVMHRYLRLPSGRVVPLASLFCRDAGAPAALATVIEREAQPHSDAELARELARLGHRVARRTVAKYRAGLGIPPQHERAAKLASR
jgi:RNA polymerase sigma-54 factor